MLIEDEGLARKSVQVWGVEFLPAVGPEEVPIQAVEDDEHGVLGGHEGGLRSVKGFKALARR
jgi:hypothetical protein